MRLDLTELESILRTAGKIEKSESINDGHVEWDELVLRLLSENEEVKVEHGGT